jgi:hypothetical protein
MEYPQSGNPKGAQAFWLPFYSDLDWPLESGHPLLARQATSVNPQTVYVSTDLPN